MGYPLERKPRKDSQYETFTLSNDIAMQVVAVGFIIGVIQGSLETALNSSTDVVFTAAACIAAERKESVLAGTPSVSV